MREVIGLLVMAVAVMVLALAIVGPCSVQAWGIEPLPQTIWDDELAKRANPPKFPQEEKLWLIGRLAEGIRNWKLGRDHVWYECGEKKWDTILTAETWAYHLVKAAWEASDASRHDAGDFELNVWLFAATSAHESGFDRCALGLKPRKYAYRKGIIKYNKVHISHTRSEILNFCATIKGTGWFAKSGIDIGPFQELTAMHPRQLVKMMTIEPAVYWAAQRMRRIANRHNTERPWRWWRGPELAWYDGRVSAKARRIGATKAEIQKSKVKRRRKPRVNSNIL